MSAQENKRIARLYHQFDVEQVDALLSPDFVGHHSDGTTWDRASHKTFWSSEAMQDVGDTIHVQIAEGDWVATHFTRAGAYQGKPLKLPMMAFKRFEDGKIVEAWEQYDRKLLEE